MSETTDAGDGGQGLEELLQAMKDRFPLGLMAQMRRQFDNAGSAEIEDAVLGAIESLVKRLDQGPPVRDVRAYLAKSTFNTLRKTTSRRREIPVEQHPDAETPSAEDEAFRHALIDLLKAEIRTWDNARMKQTMLIYTDMIAAGEVLESEDVAEMVAMNLGEPVTPLAVRQWKRRGLQKLRDFVQNADLSEHRRARGEEESK